MSKKKSHLAACVLKNYLYKTI